MPAGNPSGRIVQFRVRLAVAHALKPGPQQGAGIEHEMIAHIEVALSDWISVFVTPARRE
jgi:hypothetical protein